MGNRPKPFLVLFVILSIFSSNFSSCLALSSVEYSISPDMIITYEILEDKDLYYDQYVITNITQNDTHICVNYSVFSTLEVDNFPSVPNETFFFNYSGDLTQDLFFEKTISNILVPQNTNFTGYIPQIQSVLDTFAEDIDLNIESEINVGCFGYCFHIEAYVRLLARIKVLDLRVYYSTTGFLLREEIMIHDPTTDEDSFGYVHIIPLCQEQIKIIKILEILPKLRTISKI